VIHSTSNEQGVRSGDQLISETAAIAWLIKNEHTLEELTASLPAATVAAFEKALAASEI
jgi:hypothetical protein